MYLHHWKFQKITFDNKALYDGHTKCAILAFLLFVSLVCLKLTLRPFIENYPCWSPPFHSFIFFNPSLSYPKASVARFLHYSCDKIFVTDLGLHKMYIVDLKTGEQAIHGNYGSNHGQFTKPTGLISDDRCSAIVVLCTK